MRLSSGLHVPDYYRRDRRIEIIDPLKMPPLPDAGRMPAVIPMRCAVAPSYSGTTSATAGGISTLSLTTLTVSAGSDLGLVAFLITGGAVTDTSINWDAAGTPQAMTSAGVVSNTRRVEAFYLINPTAGNKTLTASWTTARDAIIIAMALSGCDQTTMIEAADTNSATGNSGTATVDITSTADGATVAGFGGTNVFTTTVGTEFANRDTSGPDAAGSYTLGGTSNTHTCTHTSAIWAVIGIHVKAAAAGGGGFGQPLGGRRNNPVAMMG